jgi:hypothetical protein
MNLQLAGTAGVVLAIRPHFAYINGSSVRASSVSA